MFCSFIAWIYCVDILISSLCKTGSRLFGFVLTITDLCLHRIEFMSTTQEMCTLPTDLQFFRLQHSGRMSWSQSRSFPQEAGSIART